MTIEGAYYQIKEWKLSFYSESSRKKVLETIEEYFDAVSVIHGHWVPAKKETSIGIFNGKQCSVCKKISVGKPENGGNYCEDCGAKMDEEDDEQDEMGRN